MITNAELLNAKISEADWRRTVTDTLEYKGWRVFHIGDSRRADSAILDILAVRPPRVMFLELKTTTGKLTKTKLVRGKRRWYERMGQEQIVEILQRCPGVEVYVLRPQDFEFLERIAGDKPTNPTSVGLSDEAFEMITKEMDSTALPTKQAFFIPTSDMKKIVSAAEKPKYVSWFPLSFGYALHIGEQVKKRAKVKKGERDGHV